jgi:signal transduction histidine kinase
MIDDAVRECERIVSKTKNTEHLATVPLSLRNLRSVIIDCIDAFHEDEEHLVIESIFSIDEAPILADNLLECLVDNLLENAIKHNTSQDPQIWIKILQKNYGYEVSIADNGPGIIDAIKKDLFNSTRRFGGVGLHQVKEILEKYKGRVEVCDRVSNRPECGVEFRLWFPKATHKLVSKNSE